MQFLDYNITPNFKNISIVCGFSVGSPEVQEREVELGKRRKLFSVYDVHEEIGRWTGALDSLHCSELCWDLTWLFSFLYILGEPLEWWNVWFTEGQVKSLLLSSCLYGTALGLEPSRRETCSPVWLIPECPVFWISFAPDGHWCWSQKCIFLIKYYDVTLLCSFVFS